MLRKIVALNNCSLSVLKQKKMLKSSINLKKN